LNKLVKKKYWKSIPIFSPHGGGKETKGQPRRRELQRESVTPSKNTDPWEETQRDTADGVGRGFGCLTTILGTIYNPPNKSLEKEHPSEQKQKKRKKRFVLERMGGGECESKILKRERPPILERKKSLFFKSPSRGRGV